MTPDALSEAMDFLAQAVKADVFIRLAARIREARDFERAERIAELTIDVRKDGAVECEQRWFEKSSGPPKNGCRRP